jgi:hypothetical protein
MGQMHSVTIVRFVIRGTFEEELAKIRSEPQPGDFLSQLTVYPYSKIIPLRCKIDKF